MLRGRHCRLHEDPGQMTKAPRLSMAKQVSEKIQRYLDAGCTGFIPWCPDYPSTETIELLAKQVMPNFR